MKEKFRTNSFLKLFFLTFQQSERLCEDCGKTCSNLQAYRKHIQIHKKDEKSFKCTFCKKAYVREEKYKLHLQKHNK